MLKDLEIQRDALKQKLKAISSEIDKAESEADVEAFDILEASYNLTVAKIQEIETQLNAEIEKICNHPLDWGFVVKEGTYYDGWSQKRYTDKQAVYCKELCETELKALKKLTGISWEQSSEGRLYFRVPFYRNTCWGDAQGLRVIQSLAKFVPAFNERVKKQISIHERRKKLAHV